MDIDLGQDVVFNVKYRGREHVLREPTTSEVKVYLEKLEGGDSIDPFIELVTSLGMPSDVAESLGFTKLKNLAEGILGGLAEKK